MSARDEIVTVSHLRPLARLRWRITTALYLARCSAARLGVPVETIIRGWIRDECETANS